MSQQHGARQFRVEVVVGGGGGGAAAAAETLLGEATGSAYTAIPVFSWTFEPRLQFADGGSLINFTVTGSGNGANISLNNYTIHNTSGWTIAPNPANQNSISGTVKSSAPSKGKLKIKYQGKDMDESADEIAFAKVDLAIASIGTAANLAEDRQPGGGAAPSPNEMDPGGIVIAPIQGSSSGGKRTKLTLTGNGGSLNEGTYTLSSTGASKLKIYEVAEGGSALPQEKHYSASELSGPKTLYVGSDAFGPDDQTQTGTITLTYKLPLKAGGQTHEIKDEVKVNLLPVDIKVKQPIIGSALFADEADINEPKGQIQNDLIKFPITANVPTDYAGVVKIDSSWTVTSEERGIATGGLVAFFKVDAAGSINIARWKEHCNLPVFFDEQFEAYERLIGPVPEEYYITINGRGSWVKDSPGPDKLKLALSELRKHPGTTGSIKVKATLYILKQADYAQLNWNKLPTTGATETLTNNITPNRFRNPPRGTTDYFTDPSGVSGAITSVSDEQTFEW